MTTTVRSVRVEMDLGVARYVANARLVGRETDAMGDRIEKRFGSLNREVGMAEVSLRKVERAENKVTETTARMNIPLAKTEGLLRRNTSQLDTFSGRAGIALKLAAGFGPALLPIGAIGVPALAGLAAQGGFAAGALGASVLALRGVGDGLKAIEKARLDPTVENLQAAQLALHDLGPDAAQVVVHLDELRDTGDKLRRSAAAGFMPGLDDALTSLETRAPEARMLLRELGDVSGDILAGGAESLVSDRWSGFFDYLRTNARPILDDTADAVGNVAHGIASIFVATSSEQQAFTAWLRETTEDFDDWASGLEGNRTSRTSWRTRVRTVRRWRKPWVRSRRLSPRLSRPRRPLVVPR